MPGPQNGVNGDKKNFATSRVAHHFKGPSRGVAWRRSNVRYHFEVSDVGSVAKHPFAQRNSNHITKPSLQEIELTRPEMSSSLADPGLDEKGVAIGKSSIGEGKNRIVRET